MRIAITVTNSYHPATFVLGPTAREKPMVTLQALLLFLRRAYRRPRIAVPIVTLGFAIIVVVGIGPVIQGYVPTADVVAAEMERLVAITGDDTKRSQSLERTIEPTWLTTASIHLSAKWDDDKKRLANIERSIRGPDVRVDRLALIIASWLLAVMLLVLGPGLATPSVSPLQLFERDRLPAENILEKEAEFARTQAQALYSRSTLLLLGGILIAFLGVVVFYLALPQESQIPVRAQRLQFAHRVLLGEDGALGLFGPDDPVVRRRLYEMTEERRFRSRAGVKPEETARTTIETLVEKSPEQFASVVKEVLAPVSFKDVLSEHFARALRPFGILIFIEGIAWFLLRQYRSLMEDYKAFNRGYIRRVNTLVAYKLLLENPKPTTATTAFIGALFSEDLSGRLLTCA